MWKSGTAKIQSFTYLQSTNTNDLDSLSTILGVKMKG